MAIELRRVFALGSCALIFAAGCYVLAFGGAILCCAPGRPEAAFWQTEAVVYGLLPLGAGIAVSGFALRLLARTFVRRRNAWLAGCAVAIFAVAGDLALFLKFRGKQQDARLDWSGGHMCLAGGAERLG